MTFFGKVFVMVITTVSLLALGLSTVALTSATDWRAEIKKQDEIKGRLQGQLTAAQAGEADAKGRFEAARKDRVGATKVVEAMIATLEGDIKKAQADTTKAREGLAEQQTAAKSALETVKTRTEEIVKLREQVAAITAQSGKFQGRQEDLNAELVNVRRMLQAAETNASQLGQTR